jgi:hypothetical protein
MPVRVAARSNAYVYGPSSAAIMGSNHTEGMDFVRCVCCVLSGRGLCDELITRPENPTDCGASSCVTKKPRETRRPMPALGCRARENKLIIII